MYDELFYRLALDYQYDYGLSTIKSLLKRFDSATDIFQNFTKKLKLVESNKLHPPVITSEIERSVSKEIRLMERHGVSHCFITDENYPKRLKMCVDAPYHFFYKGSSDFDFERSLAIVGTRNSSTYGEDCVKHIVEGLSSTNVVIVSGLAFGVDAVAHEQALANSLKTVAVMGTGFNVIYPRENKVLSERILEAGGTLISEYTFQAKADRYNFPKRNRIIAGLSDATLVAETAQRGGSMITAYIAHSYNRDVFAVPGNVFQKSYEGCHELIRKNVAAMVTSGNDIVEMMNWDAEVPRERQLELFIELSEDERKIVDFIQSRREATIDEIIAFSPQLSVSKVTALLLGLEFKNVLRCQPGKKYVKQ
ncbi:MAG: DNA-processing protein DprA [Bacteroidales bacterium]|nr:DNA-processing protein DprA [Bacteroidales bacterium]